MQQNRRLVLFTNYYPFYKGEEYIENEISIMASSFEKVMIVPTMVDRNMKQTRDVPDNVEVLNIKTDCSKKGKISMVLKKAPVAIASIDWKHTIRNETGLFPNKIAYEIYYLSRVEYVYERIVNNNQFKHFIKNSERIVLYSYWMHAVASITARIKDRVFQNKVRCITRGHRYDLYGYAAPCGFVPDREYALSHIDKIYPCSQDGVDYLKNKFPKFAEKIEVRRLGTMSQSPIKCVRKPVFTLVSCAGVRKVKRLDKIIDVVRIVNESGVRVRWVHIGDGPELESIKKVANKELRNGSFEFIGRLDNRAVYDWYKNNKVSCFINLSDSEGVPVAIMEAMSFGIPIVATDVGGTREIIENGKNGYIVSSEDNVEKIVYYINDLIRKSDEDYEEMCESSRSLWDERANAIRLYNVFFKDI